MNLHDSIIWPHIPRYDHRTRIFLREGLYKFMTKDDFQRPPIVFT